MFDEGNYFDNWIIQFKGINKIYEKIQFILIILYSLDDNIQNNFRNNILKYEKILVNHQFIREIKHRDALVEEYATEYFGKDYKDDPYKYKVELEKTISELNLDIMATLGLVIKRLKNEDFALPSTI